ncbi:MAG: cell division protein FtsZ [Chthoniobacter sp.]|nr:cell division protein FtsZ [Chthoniobacter sp.]
MIQVHRNSASTHDVRIKVVGLGGAGGNVLDRLLLDGLHDAELIAINTDAQALTASVVERKVQLGRTTTRGLGAGGDPEIGYTAAEEGVEEIRQAIEGAQIVFLCVGLGGGTGSGGARIVASLAREQKSLVIAFATLPFAFEGKRRRAQADEALAALQRYSDVVIHFDNDRMGDAVAPLAGIHEAFTAADQTLSQSIRAIARVVRQRGLVHIGFDDLTTALRGSGESGAHCIFGYGEADGDNRAHDALTRALKNPLMDKGRMLEDARNILVNVAGGPSMTLNEVQILMEELNRHISDQTRLLFGAAVDPALGQKISVTILSALQGEVPAPIVEVRARPDTRVESSPASVAPTPVRRPPPVLEPVVVIAPIPEPEHVPEPKRAPAPRRAAPEPEPEPVLVEAAAPAAAIAEAEPLFAEPAPAPEPVRTAAPKQAKPKPIQAKQEQMQFEPVTRGRFEKSEPTIVDGQDLDVPTFLRRNVKVK